MSGHSDSLLAWCQLIEWVLDSVAVTVKTYGGLPHGFYMFPHLKQTTEYYQSIVDWVSKVQEFHGNLSKK